MLLIDYIAKLGDEKFADKFGITVRCAESWRLKQRRPRLAMALKIEKKTRGVVTARECYPDA